MMIDYNDIIYAIVKTMSLFVLPVYSLVIIRELILRRDV